MVMGSLKLILRGIRMSATHLIGDPWNSVQDISVKTTNDNFMMTKITKLGIHPPGVMDFCTEFCGNPSFSLVSDGLA